MAQSEAGLKGEALKDLGQYCWSAGMVTWRCQHCPLGGSPRTSRAMKDSVPTPAFPVVYAKGCEFMDWAHSSAEVSDQVTGLSYYLYYFQPYNFKCMIYALCLNLGQWQI